MKYPRREYQMTEEQFQELMKACRPVPYMIIGGHEPPSQQENANRAWAALGLIKGFDSDTVEPVRGKDAHFFTAVPSETEEQRAERELAERALRMATEIEVLTKEIEYKQQRLEMLRKDKA